MRLLRTVVLIRIRIRIRVRVRVRIRVRIRVRVTFTNQRDIECHDGWIIFFKHKKISIQIIIVGFLFLINMIDYKKNQAAKMTFDVKVRQ